ncbi:MAG: hypothetical protein H7833_04535 [Magnetococcus sp. DMHC-1]
MKTQFGEPPVEDRKKSLVQQIAASKPTSNSISVQLFVSLDLVNSTAFKNKAAKWPFIIDRFYNLSESHIIGSSDIDDVDRFRVWKYIGDEVLFHRPVNKLGDIPHSIVLVFEKVNEISREIMSLCKEEGYPVGLLDVKATVWIALIHHSFDVDQSFEQKNILRPMSQMPNTRSFDFLGPDIDSGFRVASHADKRKVTISAKLGGVLLHPDCCKDFDDGFLNHFKIVYYARLKGIWHGAPYPIIWFHRDWDNIKRTFSYAERLDPEAHDLGEFTGRQAIYNTLRGQTMPLSDIKEVLPVHGEQRDVDGIIEAIKNVKVEDTKRYLEEVRHSQAEVHVAAIVLSNDGSKVLLALRNSNKTTFPSHWEFGCAQLSHGDDPIDRLTKEYKNDFGIEVKVKRDIIIGMYLVERPDYSVPGFLFVATADNSIKPNRKKKHSDVQWVDVNTLEHPPNGMQYVPDLKKHVKRAVQLLDWDMNQKNHPEMQYSA